MLRFDLGTMNWTVALFCRPELYKNIYPLSLKGERSDDYDGFFFRFVFVSRFPDFPQGLRFSDHSFLGTELAAMRDWESLIDQLIDFLRSVDRDHLDDVETMLAYLGRSVDG